LRLTFPAQRLQANHRHIVMERVKVAAVVEWERLGLAADCPVGLTLQ